MFTRSNLQVIHADIQAALEAVAKKHGLIVSARGRVTFDTTTFKFSTEFAKQGAAGMVEGADPKLVSNATRFGYLHGLKPEMLGKTFTDMLLGEVTYIGMSSREKAVVKATNNGKQYRCPANVVSKKLTSGAA